MTTRSLYRFLLRMHPAGFREHYEEQMLWIFDESVESRGTASLLLDALVSLVRQWVLRSVYWRHSRPTLAVDGSLALAETLHQNSRKLFRRAWGLNIIWLAEALVVLLMWPISIFLKFQFVGLAANATALFPGRKPVRGRPLRMNYISLFYYKNSQEFYRSQIEARRDGLRAWVGKAGGIGGAGGIVGLFFVLLVFWLLRPAIRTYMGLPNSSLDWDHSRYFVYNITVWALSFRLMAKVNERAAQVIQQEIDAMGESSMGGMK